MLNFGLNVFFQVLLVFITGYLVINNNLEIGAVAAVGLFANLVFDGMSQIGYRISFIKGVKPIFSKYDDFILNSKDKHSFVEYDFTENIFKINDLSFKFKDRAIFKKFNLEIKAGKKYLICGDSGAGKPTLFKIITGQLRNYEGNVKYNGIDLKTLSTKQILENITLIQQEPFIFSGTVKDNIVLGEIVADSEVEKYLRKVGFVDSDKFLNKEVGSYGKNLSGGQKQRIAIARALFNGKKIILIDEGTSALDKASARSLELLLLRNSDLTVLMISHDISDEIKQNFDYSISIGNNNI